jgi:chromosomal replication initiation ATPase DnaA
VRDFIYIPPFTPKTDWKADLQELAQSYGVTVHEITGPLRQKHIVPARHHAMAMLRDRGWSYPEIGAKLGGRDHSTVIHGIKKHYERTRAGREHVTSETT